MAELNIKGYVVPEALHSENAGNSSWGCAFKNGKKFFIKQLKETYYDIPYAEASAFQREDMEISRLFYERMTKLLSEIKSADNGNIVAPIEFIRQGGHYYIVSEWVDQFSDFGEIRGFTPFNKHLMMKVLTYSIYGLSEHHIVHCDLKPDNIRIKETINKAKTLKIIDFDSGFIEGEYPQMMGGTPTYMAPELIVRVHQDEEGEIPFEKRIPVTTKSDIFSLGLIFHEILTGNLPKWSNPKFKDIGLAVGYDDKVHISSQIPYDYAELIRLMLLKEPTQRPDAIFVFQKLSAIDPMKLNDRR